MAESLTPLEPRSGGRSRDHSSRRHRSRQGLARGHSVRTPSSCPSRRGRPCVPIGLEPTKDDHVGLAVRIVVARPGKSRRWGRVARRAARSQDQQERGGVPERANSRHVHAATKEFPRSPSVQVPEEYSGVRKRDSGTSQELSGYQGQSPWLVLQGRYEAQPRWPAGSARSPAPCSPEEPRPLPRSRCILSPGRCTSTESVWSVATFEAAHQNRDRIGMMGCRPTGPTRQKRRGTIRTSRG